jgi:hypothetical protein
MEQSSSELSYNIEGATEKIQNSYSFLTLSEKNTNKLSIFLTKNAE